MPTRSILSLRAGAGSYGENEQAAIANFVRGKWSEAATGARNFSTGFIANRDYRTESASSETRYNSTLGATSILLAGSDRAFGANQFYGNYPSWERTKGWFASASQQLGPKTRAAFAYRRHTDNFILFRNEPAIYANNHMELQAVARREILLELPESFTDLNFRATPSTATILAAMPAIAAPDYASLDLHFRRRGTLSSAHAKILSGGPQSVFSPDLSGSLFLGRRWKLRAAGGYGFRLPTYTDLYYSDPTSRGNARLKPESAWSGEGGVRLVRGPKHDSLADVFYSRHMMRSITCAPALRKMARPTSVGCAFSGVEDFSQLASHLAPVAAVFLDRVSRRTVSAAWA